MKQIVPGIAIIFCIFWIYMAVRAGAPWFFVLFGIGFLCLIVYVIVRNHTGQTRGPTDSPEEPDDVFEEQSTGEPEMEPDADLDGEPDTPSDGQPAQPGVCPFCGGPVTPENRFCESCGRRLEHH